MARDVFEDSGTFGGGVSGVSQFVSIPIGSAISPGQPASGTTQLIIGPPSGRAWKVKSLRAVYTCDGTAGDRVLVASFTSVANSDSWSAAAGVVAQAGHIIEVSGGSGGAIGNVAKGSTNGGENLTQVINITWPDAWLTFDSSLRIWMFLGTGAGDTFSSAQALIEEVSL